ncbi:MAG: serine/threonine protein kinase [Polyangiaceae bacterium]|nr:serine/threonine protein kinase [Polyangiaceae bacterium]
MFTLQDIQPGAVLGRYEILMPIAEGGMAAVWAARMKGSRGFQKVVAIKTMLPDLSDDQDFEAMFYDESRLIARIRHPHVVEMVDLGDENGMLYIVMEWVDGDTLFTLNRRAKNKGGIPLPLLLRIAADACAGMHAAHELRDDSGKPLGLVHRDVSPQNIMITFDGIVKIVDFGVAKAAGRTHETRVGGLMKGKVPYLSPEQLNTGKVDRRSDVFSLGIVLYAMVSGRHPFRANDDARTIENICTRAPVPLHELVPDVNPELEAIVLRALEKEPEKRWQTAAEMQRALDQLLGSMGLTVTDGDIAAFLQDTLGDIIEQRRSALKEAIKKADGRAPSESGAGRSKPRPKGGAPLPATFDGILPVLLDDDAPPPSRTPTSLPVPSSKGTQPDSAPRELPVVKPSKPEKSNAVFYVITVVMLLVAAVAVAAAMGKLPFLKL